jgi:type IV secretory pathway VirB10-like protein
VTTHRSNSSDTETVPQAKARRTLTVLLTVLATLLWSIACQKVEAPTSNANSASTNTSASTNSATPSTANANQSKVNAEAPQSPGSGSLATPTEAYKTAYAARKNKDLATLKRAFSKDALGFLTDMGKLENKTLDDELKELFVKPQAASADTRNEKINGNRATLEYLDEKGKWAVMDFSKDGNEWKIDLPKGP